ncbi:uncharacterized protein N7515_007740 [Penicillium bovifimosum]|uniref:DNA helicase Pif1-like 2B domain-containing protein n=1 Tax=Penicillium bovifimosum TaxID=126998 RepID=A0A9W9GN62_9EURO|nr:uncharacterized protein N7515_007740 [Penicillium bovifimosum]KAJ5123915.1 hypothetical protein N7515_007740 [Penicillium bovifimosum]
MPGRSRTYWSADRVQGGSGGDQPTLTEHPPEYLHSNDISSLSPSELALKVGALIMLIRNLRQEDGL